jgi:predicted nucleic acid-binding protein
MPIDRVVINASPLIVLFKSNQADLLTKLFSEVLVPQAVWQEVTISKNDIAAQQLAIASWARPVEVAIHPLIATWDLGAGESTVLSYALEHSGYRAMIDDAAARRCARTLGIQTLGTGGAIVLAKKRGLIDSVDVPLQALRDAGLWLLDSVVNLLKQQAGESNEF